MSNINQGQLFASGLSSYMDKHNEETAKIVFEQVDKMKQAESKYKFFWQYIIFVFYLMVFSSI